MIENTFFKSMDSLGPFENKPNLAIGVSGGSDSLFLTLLTNEWVKKKNGKLTALVVDHNLRKQSKYECKIIQKILQKILDIWTMMKIQMKKIQIVIL